jgi:hypothetical protein
MVRAYVREGEGGKLKAVELNIRATGAAPTRDYVKPESETQSVTALARQGLFWMELSDFVNRFSQYTNRRRTDATAALIASFHPQRVGADYGVGMLESPRPAAMLRPTGRCNGLRISAATCTYSLHFCEFGPGFLQNRDIGIGIFPECKKLLVCGFCSGLIS